ncbi:HNH endonuclease [Ferrovibrio xuzhouensis]|uniref:HNH endonuclease n=1 Tax=Ferrovibrio xuzhouensis TaxID=1576914 RepID=A0ABV7V9C6_9PROT
MPVCIYCEKEKPASEMTLEHVIPKFLGGACAPDRLKTNRVCQKCNNDLGLFVDASFAKSYLVEGWLNQQAFRCYDPKKPTGLPLIFLHKLRLELPGISEIEDCDLYSGPLAERIIWVRHKDERLYWYTGGNPRTAKDRESRAYFFLSKRSHQDFDVVWRTFHAAFKGQKVRKVLAAQIEGLNPIDFGFSPPDALDQQRIDFLTEPRNFVAEQPKGQVALNLHHDFRFLAKLARGIGFCLVGDKALTGRYAEEVSQALRYRAGSEMPALRGVGSLHLAVGTAGEIIGHESAVVVILSQIPEGIGISLHIGPRVSSAVLCLEAGILTDGDRKSIGNGVALILFPFLGRAVELPLLDYLLHRLGQFRHPDLAQIEDQIGQNKDYFGNLAAISRQQHNTLTE